VYKKRWKSGNQYSYFQNLSNQLIFTLWKNVGIVFFSFRC
jgi:hypothetical protein